MKVDTEQELESPPPEGNETILIAEDDSAVRHLVQEVLEQSGYTVIDAADGEEAMQKFRDKPSVNLVLLDIVMPKKDGVQVYREIHELDPRARILFMSGYTKDVAFEKTIENERLDFVTKPLLLEELLRKIREVLDR